MRNPDRAREALARAERQSDEIDRTVWLAKAVDHAIKSHAVLVGGSAVNLHTGSYRPTDIDMCAYLDEADRRALRDLGFEQSHGDHFAYTFTEGERWLIEFPDSQVDGDVMTVELDVGETLNVISVESLVVDRLLQATDGTRVTFDEAVRLSYAVLEHADWDRIEIDIRQRSQIDPSLSLFETYERVIAAARRMLDS